VVLNSRFLDFLKEKKIANSMTVVSTRAIGAHMCSLMKTNETVVLKGDWTVQKTVKKSFNRKIY
jgi:hypothetical protein